jgi:hypothetical protein
MLKRTALVVGVAGCVLAVGDGISAAGADIPGSFSGQYIIYGGLPRQRIGKSPLARGYQDHVQHTGPAAKDMFDAIGAAPRSGLSRGEERCEKNPRVRTRDLDTIRCRYHPKDGYWCVFGFDLSTGLATWGKPAMRCATDMAVGESAGNRRMVNRHASLGHHFLDVPVAQRVGCVPANTDQDDVSRETHSFEAEHIGSSSVRAH